MSANLIEVELRKENGKNAARRLRANGQIPAVVYGGGKETVSITVGRKVLQDYFRNGATDNSIFLLQMKGTDQKRHAMIRSVATDPVSQLMVHLDFIRVDMDHKIKVRVPIVLTNVAACAGVKVDAGVLDFEAREVEIECLPGSIPSQFEVDVTELRLGKFLRISEIGIDPAKYRILGDPEKVVAHVVHAHRTEEAEVVAAPGTPEPEVIKKGKKEEEAAPAAKPGKK